MHRPYFKPQFTRHRKDFYPKPRNIPKRVERAPFERAPKRPAQQEVKKAVLLLYLLANAAQPGYAKKTESNILNKTANIEAVYSDANLDDRSLRHRLSITAPDRQNNFYSVQISGKIFNVECKDLIEFSSYLTAVIRQEKIRGNIDIDLKGLKPDLEERTAFEKSLAQGVEFLDVRVNVNYLEVNVNYSEPQSIHSKTSGTDLESKLDPRERRLKALQEIRDEVEGRRKGESCSSSASLIDVYNSRIKQSREKREPSPIGGLAGAFIRSGEERRKREPSSIGGLAGAFIRSGEERRAVETQKDHPEEQKAKSGKPKSERFHGTIKDALISATTSKFP